MNNQMKSIVERKNLSRMWSILLCLLLLGTLGGCRPDAESLYDDLNDLAGKRLAVYHGVLGDSLAQVHFPGADLKDYDKTLNLFIDIEAGKRDAVVMDGVTADMVMATNFDYTCLGRIGATAEGVGGIAVMVPTRQYAPLADKELDARGWLQGWKERIHRNLFADEAWHLITGGFYTTVIIFLGAAVFAFLLAVLLTYMGINHKWGWLYHPLHWFVFTIHDIPSVVLMMFFYYVVFASTSLSGIVVAAIALGFLDGRCNLVQFLNADAVRHLADQNHISLTNTQNEVVLTVREQSLHHVGRNGFAVLQCTDYKHAAGDICRDTQFLCAHINIAQHDIVRNNILNKRSAIMLFLIIRLGRIQSHRSHGTNGLAQRRRYIRAYGRRTDCIFTAFEELYQPDKPSHTAA